MSTAATASPARDFDVFISYARADNAGGWVSLLVEKLVEQVATDGAPEPLRPFFDKADIRGGDDWEHRILTGLRVSHVFLAILSPNYFASDWCRREWAWWTRHEMHRHCIRDGAAPIYFLTVDGFPAPKSAEDIAAWIVAQNLRPGDPTAQDKADIERAVKRFQPRQAYDMRAFDVKALSTLAEQSLREQLKRLSRQVREVLDRAERAQRSPTDLPAYNPAFIGRVDDLIALRRDLALGATGITAVVHGLGGIGKTELALAYAHAYAHEYPGGRYLVKCAGAQDWCTVLERFGDARGWTYPEPVRQDAERHFAALLESLHGLTDHKGRSLLICDNVDTDRLLREGQITQLRLRNEHFHLLFTTRLEAPPQTGAASLIHWKALDSLPIEDATELLEVLVQPADPAERSALGALAAELGGFTIAVELAGRHLHAHPEVRPTRLLAKIKKTPLEELGRTAGLSGDHLIRHQQEARLDFILEETIEKLSPPELRTLEYAAQLAPDVVPVFFLRRLLEDDFPEFFNLNENAGDESRASAEERWTVLVRRLLQLRLLVRPEEHMNNANDALNPDTLPKDPASIVTDSTALVTIHRLVQEIVRTRCGPKATERRQSAGLPIKTTCLFLREGWQNPKNRWFVPVLERTADAWLARAERGEQELVSDAILVANEAWSVLDHFAAWNRAEPLLRRALKLAEAQCGCDSHEMAGTLNNLAELLRVTNRLTEAEPMFKRALEILERVRGPEHPNVATAHNNLGLLLHATGRLAEAEPMHRRALEIDEKSHGLNHLDVARDLNNLAELLRDTERHTEAEPLYRRALAIKEKGHRQPHPDVALAINNLALLLQATSRLAEAEALFLRALNIDEVCLGLEHPNVARDLNNLAALLLIDMRLAEAEPLLQRAVAIDEKNYGADHPEVATDLSNLSGLLCAANRLAEAEPLARRQVVILAKTTAAMRREHPNLQTAFTNYHCLLMQFGLTQEQATERLRSAMAEGGLELQ